MTDAEAGRSRDFQGYGRRPPDPHWPNGAHVAGPDGNTSVQTPNLPVRSMAVGGLIGRIDNGAPFPREKGTLYDSGTRTPLIFSWPPVIRAGTTYSDGLVSTVDLAPTILDLAGAHPPAAMQGRSLRALFTAPASYPGRTYVFSERNWHDCDEHQRSVRTRIWRTE